MESCACYYQIPRNVKQNSLYSSNKGTCIQPAPDTPVSENMVLLRIFTFSLFTVLMFYGKIYCMLATSHDLSHFLAYLPVRIFFSFKFKELLKTLFSLLFDIYLNILRNAHNQLNYYINMFWFCLAIKLLDFIKKKY